MKALQIIGALLVTVGLALGTIGTYRICTNLPLSDDKVWEDARKAVLEREGKEKSPHPESLPEKAELDVWTSALKMTNEGRAENRGEATFLLFSWILSVIWGVTLFYSSKKTSKGP